MEVGEEATGERWECGARMTESESSKEEELREPIESLRPANTVLWGDGLGAPLFWLFAFLPYAVLEKEAHGLTFSWTLVLAGVGLMCLARFARALTLRQRIDSGLAKIDGERDPHERIDKLREFLAGDIGALLKKKGSQS